MMGALHPPLLTIDLGALAENWRRLAARAAPGACGAVVKANAYGIGIEAAVPALAKAGCTTFFVAHLSEALRARHLAPEVEIFVLNGFSGADATAYAEARLMPVLGSAGELAAWRSARKAGQSAALHIDTGMNRLGLRLEDARGMIAEGGLARDAIGLVMSHFVASEETGAAITETQIARFLEVQNLIQQAPDLIPKPRLSLCNSSGLFLTGRPIFDLARPGYALYGGNPTPGRPNPMLPVIRLEARIVQINALPVGEAVGYNENFRAARPSRIATVSCGYADGYPRNAGAKPGQPGGSAIVAGVLCPFAGNVSMDLITIDITDLSEGAAKPGDRVTLIGDVLDIDRVGEAAKTIGYELLTNLGHRSERRFIGG